jgi:hypothetical protein
MHGTENLKNFYGSIILQFILNKFFGMKWNGLILFSVAKNGATLRIL